VAPVVATARAATVLNRDFMFSSLKSRLVVQPVQDFCGNSHFSTNIFITKGNTFYIQKERNGEIFIDFVHHVGIYRQLTVIIDQATSNFKESRPIFQDFRQRNHACDEILKCAS
jgi:hypothetical protein